MPSGNNVCVLRAIGLIPLSGQTACVINPRILFWGRSFCFAGYVFDVCGCGAARLLIYCFVVRLSGPLVRSVVNWRTGLNADPTPIALTVATMCAWCNRADTSQLAGCLRFYSSNCFRGVVSVVLVAFLVFLVVVLHGC